jgi:hypothetical protein
MQHLRIVPKWVQYQGKNEKGKTQLCFTMRSRGKKLLYNVGEPSMCVNLVNLACVPTDCAAQFRASGGKIAFPAKSGRKLKKIEGQISKK